MPTYIRVKDLPNAATSPASDDFILLSGAANGARRISRADFLAAVAGFYTADPSTYKLATLDAGNKVLVSQLPSSAFSYQGTWAASTNTPTLADGTGTGGDTYYASDSGSVNFGSGSISFLAGDAVVYDGSVWQKVPDVVNLLDGKGTLDEAKTTLEIPDVGSNPDEVSLNGMLGSMAFQSSEGISVANAEVETLEVTDKVSGTLNIATGSPEAIADADADDLVIGDGVLTNFGATIATNSSGQAKINFADGAGANAARGQIKYDHQFDKLSVSTAGGERVVVDEYGRVGVGTASPSAKLHLQDTGVDVGLSIDRTDSKKFNLYVDSGGNLITRDQSAGVSRVVVLGNGDVHYQTSSAELGLYNDLTHGSISRAFIKCEGRSGTFNYGGDLVIKLRNDDYSISERLRITNSALVLGSGVGIDFGSAATSAGQGTGTTGTPANSVLSDYEYGSWEPTFKTNGTNFATMTMDVVSASYVKFGRQVICQAMIRTSNVDTTGATGVVVVDGLPFVSDSATDSHGTCTVGQAGSWVNMPEVGFTETNTAQVKLMKAGGAGFNSHLVPADFTTGATPYQNQMMFTVSYIATT